MGSKYGHSFGNRQGSSNHSYIPPICAETQFFKPPRKADLPAKIPRCYPHQGTRRIGSASKRQFFSIIFWLPSEFQSPPASLGFWCFDFFVGHGMGHESLQHMTMQATTTWCFNRSSGQRPKGVQWHVTRILSTAYAITNTLFSDEP